MKLHTSHTEGWVDTSSMQAVLDDVREDIIEARALISDACHHLQALRSTIHDGLTGNNDLFLKASLLQDVSAAEAKLRRAMS